VVVTFSSMAIPAAQLNLKKENTGKLLSKLPTLDELKPIGSFRWIPESDCLDRNKSASFLASKVE